MRHDHGSISPDAAAAKVAPREPNTIAHDNSAHLADDQSNLLASLQQLQLQMEGQQNAITRPDVSAPHDGPPSTAADRAPCGSSASDASSSIQMFQLERCVSSSCSDCIMGLHLVSI